MKLNSLMLVRALVSRCWKFRYGIVAAATAGLLGSCATGGPGGSENWHTGAAPAANDLPAKSRAAGMQAEKSEYQMTPHERPGLATGWGDEKKSAVYDAYFTRASAKPAGTDAIYYNDHDGVAAMASYKESVSGLQPAAGGLVEWGIKGRMGYLTAYKEGGYGRRLVEASKGGEYSIFVRNLCKCQLEIVLSVDGLDVMDGKTASFAKRGYLVDAGKTLEVSGFRTSYDAVAAFRFSSVGASYANMRHGDTRNVGVIGLAVFTPAHRNPWTWMPYEVNRRGTAKPFAEAPAGR